MLVLLLLPLVWCFDIHNQVLDDVSLASADAPTSIVIYLNQQFDASNDEFIRSLGSDNRDELGSYMLESLKSLSDESQADLIKYLESLPYVKRINPMFIANIVFVDVESGDIVDALQGRDDIARIESNKAFKVKIEKDRRDELLQQFEDVIQFQNDEYRQTIERIFEELIDTSEFMKEDNKTEWNIEWINTHHVWAKGYQGEGMIYANADTGVLFRHEALLHNYLGYAIDAHGKERISHDYAWWDGVKKSLTSNPGPCGVNTKEPCDDHGHGTHTTSTAVGGLGVGVAPKAKWMGCRNMHNGVGSTESYLSCLQFFLAPTDLKGKTPRPELRPIAVGNSYGCPQEEGCAIHAFTKAVENLRAAGVFMSVSAGNEGPSCRTIEAPPGYEPAVISVGALSYKSNDVAYYSSRGPSLHLGADKPVRKPNIMAPGSSVKAAFISRPLFPGWPDTNPYGKYSTLSGTSMASPHVGGAALLISQACPCIIRNVDIIQKVFQDTAVPLTTGRTTAACGGDASDAVPNNVFGYGKIELDKAIEKCLDICKI